MRDGIVRTDTFDYLYAVVVWFLSLILLLLLLLLLVLVLALMLVLDATASPYAILSGAAVVVLSLLLLVS